MEHLTRLRSAVRGLPGAHLLFLVAAVGLCRLPLADNLGFEFSTAVGILVAYVSGWRAAGAAARSRAASPGPKSPFPGKALLVVAGGNLSLLATPLGVMALRGFWVPACSLGQGLAFYALLPLPAWLFGTSIGFALGLLWPARRARLAYLGLSLLSYAHALWRLLAEPPKFAFNAFVGYFPGPIYDGEVAISSPLLVARGVVVVQALLVLCLAASTWDGTGLALRRRPGKLPGERAVPALAALVLASFLALVHAFGPPLGVRIDRRFIQESLGGHLETLHFHIYYDRGALSEARAQAFAAEHEFRYAQLARFFGSRPPRKLRSYAYGSAAQKKRLMGAAGTSFEDAWNDEFHINITSENPHPTLTHEMAHLFAAHLVPWVPVCLQIGIHEGIAVAAEWREESARLELTPDQACVAMDSLGLLPQLERSLSALGFWTQPGPRVYTACGSFVRFLLARGGMERLRVLWRRGDFEAAYGKPLEALLTEWRESLRAVRIGPRELRRAESLYRPGGIFQQPCGHELARLESEMGRSRARGDLAAATRLAERLLEIDPENPARRLTLAECRQASGDVAGARAAVGPLLDDSRAGPALRERSWRLAGDLAWAAGETGVADSAFAAGQPLAGSAADRRALEVRRAALRDTLLGPLLREYLLGSGEEPIRDLWTLFRARALRPDHPLPSYLLGRRLVLSGDPRAGALELAASLASGRLGPESTVAGLELLGRAEFATGRLQEAQGAFERLLALQSPQERRPESAESSQETISQGQGQGIEDWLERVGWAASVAGSPGGGGRKGPDSP